MAWSPTALVVSLPTASPASGREGKSNRILAALVTTAPPASAASGGGRGKAIPFPHRDFCSRCEIPQTRLCWLPSLPLSGFAFAHPGHQPKKEAERRQTLIFKCRNRRRGSRPAGRARLPAFHCGSCQGESLISKAQPRPELPETRSELTSLWTANRGESRQPLHGCYPRRPVTVQRAPRAPVLLPAG